MTTVRELVARLSTYDPDARVILRIRRVEAPHPHVGVTLYGDAEPVVVLTDGVPFAGALPDALLARCPPVSTRR